MRNINLAKVCGIVWTGRYDIVLGLDSTGECVKGKVTIIE